MKEFCIILVFNKHHLIKANETISQIRNIGLYQGDIVCLVGNDLSEYFLSYYDNIIIKKFPEIDKSRIIEQHKKFPITSDGREIRKTIQWHKMYCFHTWFRDNYKKCLYIDVGMQIFKPIDKIINLDCIGKFLAHSDAYPTYRWKLYDQFNMDIYPMLFRELRKNYNLNVDYFSTTIMLFDTKIIKDDTFDRLVWLSDKYINATCNEQSIMNLYFNWEQIKIKDSETYYYDWWERFDLTKDNYIMLKYPKGTIREL